MRTGPSLDDEILGLCVPGYYDVDDVVEGTTVWYHVQGLYFAQVKGVEYLPAAVTYTVTVPTDQSEKFTEYLTSHGYSYEVKE